MELDINLIIQLVILVVGIIAAILAKKGLIDRKDLDDTKEIAKNLAASVDDLKKKDPNAAGKLIGEILNRIADKKPLRDAFLKEANLNAPHRPDSG